MKQNLKSKVVAFIEERYPKGNSDRGMATVAVIEFLLWAEKEKFILEIGDDMITPQDEERFSKKALSTKNLTN